MTPKVVPSTYVFIRRAPGLFIEIYFPKRVSYQTEIVDALTDGVDEGFVKRYLKRHASELITELAAYPFALDTRKYDRQEGRDVAPPTVEEAKNRIDMYKSPFFGWSTYHVEGAFLNPRRRTIDDELTQVVRILFRFTSKYTNAARRSGRENIVRSIASWTLLRVYHRTNPMISWSIAERDRFIADHGPFSKGDLSYVKRNFAPIAQEATKWFDGSALLGLGFLVRRFWKRVAEVGRKEDQIWVTSFFNLGINVVQPRG